jgi:hypothetical protein
MGYPEILNKHVHCDLIFLLDFKISVLNLLTISNEKTFH